MTSLPGVTQRRAQDLSRYLGFFSGRDGRQGRLYDRDEATERPVTRPCILNQADLRQLALKRARDAKALIDGGRWEFAYYVAGYAIECALKSCVLASMIRTGLVFEDKFNNAKECLAHD